MLAYIPYMDPMGLETTGQFFVYSKYLFDVSEFLYTQQPALVAQRFEHHQPAVMASLTYAAKHQTIELPNHCS